MNALKSSTLVAILAMSSATQAAEVFVSHYESLDNVIVTKNGRPVAGEIRKAGPSNTLDLSFEALGQRFDLQLEENDRVIDALPESALESGVYAYRGHLAGNPESWARVVMYGGVPRGVVWDGKTLYAIEAPGDSAVNSTSPVIYRLDDLYIAPGTMSCGAGKPVGNAAAAYAKVQRELQQVVAQAPGAITEITMSVIGDYEFTTFHGGDTGAAAAITARFNNIDGYFSEQVGVQVNVQLIETHEDQSDPFSDTIIPDTLLNELSEYRLQTSAHNSLGLTHLYTGRDFQIATVGIAWRGALCEDYFSAGLSEGTVGVVLDSLIAAHEIGHNFGAEHDGEPGSSCENEPQTYIMAPVVSGDDQFSDCSIDVMQAVAAAASCVVPLPAVDVGIREVSGVSTVLLGADTDIEFEVASGGTVAVADVVADFVVPNTLSIENVTSSIGSCTNGAGTVSCTLGTLPGLSRETITIATTPVSVGVGTLDASVTTSDTDERLANNQESMQVTVDPAVDLVVASLSTAPVFVDNSTTVTATLDNMTSLEATNATLDITVESGLQIDSADWSAGTCTVSTQQVNCQAATFAGQSSSTLTVTATATSAGPKDVTVTFDSPQADADPANNSRSGVVNVVTQNDGGDDDDGGGGGGTTNPLLLLLLSVVGLLRRRAESPPRACL